MKYGMNKYAQNVESGDVDWSTLSDDPYGAYRFPFTLFGNAPTFAALGLGGYGLSKLLNLKKKWPLVAGLPAAYLAYLAGKKGSGVLDLYDGPKIINRTAGAINNIGHTIPYAIATFSKDAYTDDLKYTDADLGNAVLDSWVDIFTKK